VPVIELDEVSHAYGEGSGRRDVLRDVSLRLTERRIGVIGANGSGKSTFARLLNGLVLPTRGRVSIDGLDTRRDGRQVRRRVGFCFTDPDAQIVMPTVAEDVAFGLRRGDLSRQEVASRVQATLEAYGLGAHADHPAHLLSGGQKQLLALCSVLVTGPDLVVLDEPTTLLDLRNTAAVRGIVRDLAHQVVLVTHDLDLVADLDRVLVFDDARLVHDGAPETAVKFYRDLMS
jgi:biotin transport system ATP-binding protein